MKNLFILSLVVGFVQLGIGRWLNVHKGLEHMAFNHWWQYVLEGLFYSLIWFLVFAYLKNNGEDMDEYDYS